MLSSSSQHLMSYPMDQEQLAQESMLFPWIDDDCMADQPTDFFDDLNVYEDMEDED